MTDCITDRAEFSRLGRKKVQADFDGGTITSDAGAVLLREMDRQLGLIDAINDAVADPRDPRYITHTQRSMIAQRIFAIALGYEDGNDHQDLRNDPLFQILADRPVDDQSPLASPPGALAGGESRRPQGHGPDRRGVRREVPPNP